MSTSGIRIQAIFLLALLLVVAAPASAAMARTLRVSSTTGSDATGTGTLTSPYATIEYAVNHAVAGDIVRVAAGTYNPAGTIPIPNGVKLIGAGLDRTIVVGQGGPNGPIFSITNANETTLVEGFLIRGGGGPTGAAIRIFGGALPGGGPRIQRNSFQDNGVSLYGGAIRIDGSAAPVCTPFIANNTFLGNEAGQSGGAIAVVAADPYIYRCTFSGNGASGAAPTEGGGAIQIVAGRARIHRCTFIGCAAPAGSGGAIGIDGASGPVYIWETMFDGNTAEFGGGIWANANDYQTFVRNCRFENNVSDSLGGGMRIYNAAVSIDGSTFYGNAASLGASPGAISIYDADADQPVVIDSSIFRSNGIDDITNAGVTASLAVTYSSLDTAQPGTGNLIGADPLFSGSTSWALRLSKNSPCIDMGNPASALTVDWESLRRPKDGDRNGTARVDMGSYEYGTTVGRLSGNDRFSTSAAAVQDRFAESPVAIIATGRDFPDALCAAGLAGAYRAPVLLSDTDSVPSSVRSKLVDLETREAIIVGGASVVSNKVVADLAAMGIDVTRIAGSNRYATSRAVADHLAGMGYTDVCWVARGDAFPDALSLAPLAAQVAGPILLTETATLPDTILGALRAYDYEYALVAGGTSAVSLAVYNAVSAEIPAGQISRAEGSNRYATAAAVAKWAWDADVSNGEFVGLATGDDFPDALAGGAACGYERGVLLLTEEGRLHSAARDYLDDHPHIVREVYAFGGVDVLSNQVLTECAAVTP